MVQRYPKNISFGRTLQVVKVFVKIEPILTSANMVRRLCAAAGAVCIDKWGI